MLPPNIKKDFEANDPWSIAELLAFEQIRELEESVSDSDIRKFIK